MAPINLSAQQSLSQERLREVLSYDPVSGWFTYRISRLHGRCAVVAGERAGKENPVSHYRYVNIDGHAYLEHRLAIFYVLGEWPTSEVDHRNGVRNDNAWINIREASPTENKQNAIHQICRSGVRGAHEKRGKWVAAIKLQGRYIHLGVFASAAEAGAAYLAAKAKLHPFQPTPRDAAG